MEGVDLKVNLLRNSGLLLIQSASVLALQVALNQVLGLPLPVPQQAAVLHDCALLWLTPAEWFLDIPANRTDSVQLALTERLSSSLTAVFDFSDALVPFEVNGANAPEILMAGCHLDLRPAAFPAGRVVRTALADVPAILWNPGNPDRFRCLIDRAFTEHFLAWLEGTTQKSPAPSLCPKTNG
jgi:sarcosine oxidase, subunit gamma